MQLYDPTSSTPKRKSVRAPALSNLKGLRIGILENGKLNAEELLNEVATLFVQRLFWTRYHLPLPASDQRIQG